MCLLQMTKQEARSSFRSKRAKLTKEETNIKSHLIFQQFVKLNRNFETLHTYLPILKNNEVNTWIYIDEYRPADQRLVISKTDFENHRMSHFLFESKENISENRMGIPEPLGGPIIPLIEIDAVFVPLLGCDQIGNRVGYGKGFYDQFLRVLKPEVPKIGLSFFEPLEGVIDDVESHDIPLDLCVTPGSVFQF